MCPKSPAMVQRHTATKMIRRQTPTLAAAAAAALELPALQAGGQHQQRASPPSSRRSSPRSGPSKNKARGGRGGHGVTVAAFAILSCVLVTLSLSTLLMLQRISHNLGATHEVGDIVGAAGPNVTAPAAAGAAAKARAIRGAKKDERRAKKHQRAAAKAVEAAGDADKPTEHPWYNPIPSSNQKNMADITYRDLNFQTKTANAPPCTADLDPAKISFTLVTQTSEDRLWMIGEHCDRWPGPISVAVFTDWSVDEVRAKIDEVGKEYGTCQPNQLQVQTRSKADVPEGEYPVNAMRNVALQRVFTTHYFYADIDFWTSGNLHEVLNAESTRDELAADPKLALVVPAFQIRRQCQEYVDCREDNVAAMPWDVEDVLAMVKAKDASVFDPTNRGGHGSTSYMKWSKMGEADMWDIPCIVSNRYEPYVAARYCADLPPYQEAFSGYGKNKMTQVMQMRHVGYTFSQLGGVFVTHYPHIESKNREVWNEGRDLFNRLKRDESRSTGEVDWTKYKRGQVDKVFVEFRTWLTTEVEDEATTPRCEDGMDDDEKLWVKS